MISRAETASWHALEESRLQAFLGGIGLGTSLLYDYAPPGVEPLEADNPLIFVSAPLVGTGLTTTAKLAVVTKSPLTGGIADSLSSSFFALELKRLGVDALIVSGRAQSPVWVWIRDEQVEIREAAGLWGKSAQETQTWSARGAQDRRGAGGRDRSGRRKSRPLRHHQQ